MGPHPSNGLPSSCSQYSLPTPKGGKYAINPHLTEDQRFPQLRLSRKARQKTDVFAPDYIAGISPFAENDISSRSATLQIRDSTLGAGRRRLNPNASRKKFVKKRWSASSRGKQDQCCSCWGTRVPHFPGSLAPQSSDANSRTDLLTRRCFLTLWDGSGRVPGDTGVSLGLWASAELGFLPCRGEFHANRRNGATKHIFNFQRKELASGNIFWINLLQALVPFIK